MLAHKLCILCERVKISRYVPNGVITVQTGHVYSQGSFEPNEEYNNVYYILYNNVRNLKVMNQCSVYNVMTYWWTVVRTWTLEKIKQHG